jgi:hypothetical protein
MISTGRNYLVKEEGAKVWVRHIPVVWCILLCAESVRFEPMFVEAACFLRNCCNIRVRCRFKDRTLAVYFVD